MAKDTDPNKNSSDTGEWKVIVYGVILALSGAASAVIAANIVEKDSTLYTVLGAIATGLALLTKVGSEFIKGRTALKISANALAETQALAGDRSPTNPT